MSISSSDQPFSDCSVCGTEVTMTSAPEDEIPNAPRHCREDMNLVVEGGDW